MINKIITILTFPGVIAHEWAHKTMCELFGVKVHKVIYFSPHDVSGCVVHDEPRRYDQVFWISMGPLFLNSLLTVIFTIIAMNFFEKDLLLSCLFFWIAFSCGLHSFPSDADAKNLLSYSKNALRKWYNPINWLHLLTFPLVFIVWIMNELKFFWLDALYSFLLIYVTIVNI